MKHLEASSPSSLTVHRDMVRPEWVDYNGHLRDAFYNLVFSFAVDALIERIGLDAATRAARRRSVYTLETHVRHLRELVRDTPLRVDARVLAHDAKRLHVYLELFGGDATEPAAASEQMLLHVDLDGPRAAAFDADVLGRVGELLSAQSTEPLPVHAGRVIGLPRPTPGTDDARS